jgi:RND family efflux transporter MFP subunit
MSNNHLNSSDVAQANSHQSLEHNITNGSSSVSTAPVDARPTAERPLPPRRSRKIWLWGLLATLFVGSLIVWRLSRNRPPTPPALPPLPVKVQTLESSQVQSTAEFVGKLEAQERVSLQPQIQGRIEQVLVASGDRVTVGTPILALSLDQTQADVSGAIAGLNSSRAAVLTAQAQLESKVSDRAKAASDVKLQQTQFKRVQYLVSQGAQSRQQLDIAQNNLETASAALVAADKQIQATEASVAQAQSNVAQSQAQVAANQVNLNQKQVLAPIDGIVGDVSAKAGDYVTAGQTLTTITQNDALDMRISVPANNLAQLRSGLPVDLLDANNGQRLTQGSINFISPQINADAQSILVKARFSNSDRKLRDGQYVRARIVWSQQPGLLIPIQAVNRIGGQSFVYLVEEDRSKGTPQLVVHQKPVKLGDVQNDLYPILDGIKAGDRVATSNILKLRDGVPIQPES